MREVAGARGEVGYRKGDEARAWEQKGWGEAHGQGQIVRRGKFHTERLESKYGSGWDVTPCPGGGRIVNQHRTRGRYVNGRGGRTWW